MLKALPKYLLERRNNMKFEFPWISKKRAKREADYRVKNMQDCCEARTNALVNDWHRKWEPLMEKMTQITVKHNPNYTTYQLQVGFDRDMLDVGAGYNDPNVWEYITDELAYNFKRLLGTINFAGLHRLALENEYRYPPDRKIGRASCRERV